MSLLGTRVGEMLQRSELLPHECWWREVAAILLPCATPAQYRI